MKATNTDTVAGFTPPHQTHPRLRTEPNPVSQTRSYFDSDTEILLSSVKSNSTIGGLSDGKLLTLSAEEEWDRKLYSRIHSLLRESLILLVPRIKYKKEKPGGELVFHVITAKGTSSRDREDFRALLLEIHRRSAWAVRNYILESQNAKVKQLEELLTKVASGTWNEKPISARQTLSNFLNRIRYQELLKSDATDEAEEQIDAFLNEEGFLVATKNFGYVYVPETEIGSLFERVKILYVHHFLPRVLEQAQWLEEEVKHHRDQFLEAELLEIVDSPEPARSRMLNGEWARIADTKLPSVDVDFLNLATSIGTKALMNENFVRETEGARIQRNLRQTISKEGQPLSKFIRLEGRAFGSKSLKPLLEDHDFINVVYYGRTGPCICICPNSEAIVLSILGEFEEKYGFESETSISFLLLIYSNRNKIGSWFLRDAFVEAFCGAALECLGEKFPWLYRMAYFVGFRRALLPEVLHVLSIIDYEQLDRKLGGESDSRFRYSKLREDFLKLK
ncbi:exonuclease [Leptospira perolatii]|uniref:Exonuclease n=1 Tax=Leptospira perolatii TaxID=2023191 RepID=A0A2M9ZS69_9LEPT|nr:exonuclease [Leptospira perolatii]PJZ71341.1 exonuclease [Leptospira perolatii]PJZ74875.1 exonuclease [Leptospira perolatii]